MTKDFLHKFFEGKTTVDEEKQIRHWLEASEENSDIFKHERLIYDSIILTASKTAKKSKNYIFLFSRFTKIAAAVAFLLVISGLIFVYTKKKDAEFNTIYVPAGQRINLILADNTNVWLNSNTIFSYPEKFSSKSRTVHLDGEAYFEVAKNSKKPFVVKTGKGDVQVTGTKFNVVAYSKFDNFETSLFDGGVDIYVDNERQASLQPNEKSILLDGIISVLKISDPDEYLWREGLIVFNDKKLEEIFISLEKNFGVNIQTSTSELSEHTYTGKFRLSDGVDYALQILQKNIGFNYEREERTETIFIN